MCVCMHYIYNIHSYIENIIYTHMIWLDLANAYVSVPHALVWIAIKFSFFLVKLRN